MDVLNSALGILKLFAPLAIFAVGVLTAWGILKWTARLGKAFKELASSPFKFIFGLIVVILCFWIYFQYVQPLWP